MKFRSSIRIAAVLFALIFVSGISAQPSNSAASKESPFEAVPAGGSGEFTPVAPNPLIVNTTAIAVPEPGTLSLLAVAGVGGLAVALRRWRNGHRPR